MPFVKTELCVGCGACVRTCPSDAIYMKDSVAVIDHDKCTKCGQCIDACPKQAIKPNSENNNLRGQGQGLGRIGGHKRGSGQGRGRGRFR